jgi:glycosyltransferase involved in cell wall biosynthesis
MDQIKFNIIIPTRERAETLYWTLKTCLNQDYQNYEIWVSDNCSTDDTESVVKGFHDPKIRYLNTKKRIGMSENWEFALDHIQDGYVMVLGDDDALMPDCLNKVNTILLKNKVDAIAAQSHHYGWPNSLDNKTRDTINIKQDYHYKITSTKKGLKDVEHNFNYSMLPTIYRGFIDVNIIKAIKIKYGSFFLSTSPDVYSCVVIASEIKNYIFSYYPFTISGTSGKSIGASHFIKDGNNAIAINFKLENKISFHKKFLECINMTIVIAECFYQVHDRNKNFPLLSMKKIIWSALKENAVNSTQDSYNNVKKTIEKIAGINGEKTFFHEIVDQFPYAGEKELHREISGHNPEYNFIEVDAKPIGIANIYQVSLLINQIVKGSPVRSQFPPIEIPLKAYFYKGIVSLVNKCTLKLKGLF